MHLLQANLAHVFQHLPLRCLRSDTAGKTGADFITELFQFRHGISFLRGAVNHIHAERHGRYRSGRRRCLTKGTAGNQESYKRDLGQRSHVQQLTYRCSLTSSAQLFYGTARRFPCLGFRLRPLCSNRYPVPQTLGPSHEQLLTNPVKEELPTIHPESRRTRGGPARQKPFRMSSVVVPRRHNHSRALGWQHSGDQKRPRSKVENQIARHCKLIMPSTIVICLLIPGALETQFRTQLDRCADPMTPHDRVL